METFTKLLDKVTDQNDPAFVTAGIVCTVVDNNGQTLYQHCAGTLGIGSKEPVTVDTLFWQASQTKLMTAVAIMQLVEKSLVNLDDDVAPILPELAKLEVLDSFDGYPKFVKRIGKITLRNLITHSSGVTYLGFDVDLQRWAKSVGFSANGLTDGKMDDMLVPLVAQPDKAWNYSKGLDWAGLLLMRVTKQSMEEYMSENIWKPLGMTNTTFHANKRSNLKRIAMSYGKNGKTIPGNHINPDDPEFEAGGHGTFSTPTDYVKFQTAILCGGGGILKKETVDEMFRPQLADRGPLNEVMNSQFGAEIAPGNKGTDVDYGLSGIINLADIPGRRRAGTMSWGGMPNLTWWIDRKSGITGSLFAQLLPPSEPRILKINGAFERATYSVFGNKPGGKL